MNVRFTFSGLGNFNTKLICLEIRSGCLHVSTSLSVSTLGPNQFLKNDEILNMNILLEILNMVQGKPCDFWLTSTFIVSLAFNVFQCSNALDLFGLCYHML